MTQNQESHVSSKINDENTHTQHSKSHTLSVVIPVYLGAETLSGLVDEIVSVFSDSESKSPSIKLIEVVLVNDCGPDNSDDVMRTLAERHGVVKNVWLARNFGQHAASLAGIASSRGEWIVTMDEDGQHDPRSIFLMMSNALRNKADLVYAKSTDAPPHGLLRNASSSFTKRTILPLLVGKSIDFFSSYRLILGEVGRTISAYATNDVFLDVAISWVVRRTEVEFVSFRREGRSQSSYRPRTLARHFLRLVLTSGTRPLRIASFFGFSFFFLGLSLAVAVVVAKVFYTFNAAGWASLVSLILVLGGVVLLVLGIIAEYVGVLVRAAIGRPVYVITNDRQSGPLYRQ